MQKENEGQQNIAAAEFRVLQDALQAANERASEAAERAEEARRLDGLYKHRGSHHNFHNSVSLAQGSSLP